VSIALQVGHIKPYKLCGILDSVHVSESARHLLQGIKQDS